MKKNKKELGQGIRALLKQESSSATLPSRRRTTSDHIKEIELDKIQVNPFQPRNEFEKEALAELAESIKIHGVIQPITVRKLNANSFQIISGERRVRASQMAGKKSIPAYIRKADDQGLLEMALIENVQRENLNAIEIALSLQRLLSECGLTHDQLAERISKKRSSVTNYLRLLKLPPDIQLAIKNKYVSMGHAKALLSLDEIDAQLVVFKEILNQGLSVRATESMVKKFLDSGKKQIKIAKALPLEYKKIEERLSSVLGSKVSLKRAASGKGSLTIPFANDDQLNDLIDLIEEIQ